MTWTWTLTKIGIGWGLGTISSNPIGWAIGIPTSELIKLKNEEYLNSSTLTLNAKEDAQRWIELATDYQWGAGIGMAFKGLGAVASEMSNITSSIGKEASKEIASHGFKTEVARNLISNGQLISKAETVLKNAPKVHETEEKIRNFFKLVKESLSKLKDDEFINNAKVIIEGQNLIIDKIELLDFSEKDLLNSIRDTILELNQKNVKLFIKYEKNKEEHHLINREINKTLIRIKGIQLDLHNDHNCCENCRFCKECSSINKKGC